MTASAITMQPRRQVDRSRITTHHGGASCRSASGAALAIPVTLTGTTPPRSTPLHALARCAEVVTT
jgi:hypothetical protein